MADPNRFTKSTIETLAKRANNICSNPYCSIPTSGAHTQTEKSINVGEAAHIKGAKPGSARYDSNMTEVERRNISNGIRLCRKCAKLIDSDDTKYTTDVLHNWRLEHEENILLKIEGRTLEQDLLKIEASFFDKESPVSKQLVIDKPDYWEFLLTIELLRNKLKIIDQKYDEIKNGLLFNQHKFLSDEAFFYWTLQRMNDLTCLIEYVTKVVTDLIPKSRGEPGEAGDSMKILYSVNKLNEACEHLINRELELKYTIFDDKFQSIKNEMFGWTELMYSQIKFMLEEMERPFKKDNPKGRIHIQLVFNPPKNIEKIGEMIKYLNEN